MMPAIAIDSGGFFSPEIACQDGKKCACLHILSDDIHPWYMKYHADYIKVQAYFVSQQWKVLGFFARIILFFWRKCNMKMFFDKLLGIQFL